MSYFFDSGSPTLITIPADGWYLISAGFNTDHISGGDRVQYWLKVVSTNHPSGTSYPSFIEIVATSTATIPGHTGSVAHAAYLEAGDTIEFQVWFNLGAGTEQDFLAANGETWMTVVGLSWVGTDNRMPLITVGLDSDQTVAENTTTSLSWGTPSYDSEASTGPESGSGGGNRIGGVGAIRRRPRSERGRRNAGGGGRRRGGGRGGVPVNTGPPANPRNRGRGDGGGRVAPNDGPTNPPAPPPTPPPTGPPPTSDPPTPPPPPVLPPETQRDVIKDDEWWPPDLSGN